MHKGDFASLGLKKGDLRLGVEARARSVLEGRRQVMARVKTMYREMGATIEYQMENMPDPDDWWLTEDKVNRVISITRTAVADRFRSKIAEKMGAANPAWLAEDTEEVVKALGLAMGTGINDTPEGQVGWEDVWKEIKGGKFDNAYSTMKDYQTQREALPESVMRATISKHKGIRDINKYQHPAKQSLMVGPSEPLYKEEN